MEKTAYGILLLLAVAWLVAMISGLIAAWPAGIFGLVAIVAVGLLFIKVLKEKMNNAEDDYYDKNVHK